MRRTIGHCTLELLQGDITRQEVDAIVNAANSSLAGGGGVDGAIHDAGGPAIMEETDRLYPDGCPTGNAVATGAGELPARYVFHAVGPVWQGGQRGEADQLRAAYTKCLSLALEHACRSVAFPAISTGAYGYPMDLAAEHALAAVATFLREHQAPDVVRFVLFGGGAYGAFSRVLDEMS